MSSYPDFQNLLNPVSWFTKSRFRFTKFSFFFVFSTFQAFLPKISDLLDPIFRVEKYCSQFKFRFFLEMCFLPLPSLPPPSLFHVLHTHHATQCDVCACALNVKVQKFKTRVQSGSNFDSHKAAKSVVIQLVTRKDGLTRFPMSPSTV